MKLKLAVLISMLLFCSAAVFAQNSSGNDLSKTVAKYDSLLMKAYEARDISTFAKNFDVLLKFYYTLPVAEQKNYKQALASAYYNFACTYALVGEKTKSLACLDKAVENGFFNYSHMMKDSDLNILHDEKRFAEITGKIRSIGDFLYILKRADKFNNKDERPLPEFKYQAAENPNLAELRKAFKLDSIAGTGNEISKILNLMHWIHNLVEHDGSNGNPVVKNALSMINECKTGKRGLNCRGLAIVLNECYLSMGIKSRFVTCLPKDSLKVDNDCHVINMVYSESLKKWLWIDPTFDAYVINENGELLSIEEVRERVINGKMLILNPDANWNKRTSQTKENYLYTYMAKNLYMLECPVSSEYNLETRENGKVTEYIRLLPLDYFDQKPDVQTSENKDFNSKTTTYVTNNAEYFWKVPAK
ncbi:MAG: transglutaminase-like domain-containing protein [Melioribacteraceae bacterium]